MSDFINIEPFIDALKNDISKRLKEKYFSSNVLTKQSALIENIIIDERNRLNDLLFRSGKYLYISGFAVWTIRSIKNIIYRFNPITFDFTITDFDFSMDLVIDEIMLLKHHDKGIYYYEYDMDAVSKIIERFLPSLDDDERASIMFLIQLHND
jgi:hypothetical protein